MEYEHSMEHSSMHCGSESEVLGFLTEEQKKKVALMKMDLKIQWMEVKVSDMGKMIELKINLILRRLYST
jgi:hypothetical protein